MKKFPLHDDIEIIIVDNNSDKIPDDLPTDIKLIYCTKVGSYAARNKGAKFSNSKFLVFTDADCIPDENWINELLHCTKLNPTTLIAGAIKVFSTTQPNFVESFDLLFGFTQKLYVKKGLSVTANLLVPKNVFEEVGGFSERLLSGGDMEFCNRCNKEGYKIAFAENAIIYHPARKSFQELLIRFRRKIAGQINSGFGVERFFCFLKICRPPIRLTIFGLYSKHSLIIKCKALMTMLIVWLYSIVIAIYCLFSKSQFRK